jgi:hypothetical protein
MLVFVADYYRFCFVFVFVFLAISFAAMSEQEIAITFTKPETQGEIAAWMLLTPALKQVRVAKLYDC